MAFGTWVNISVIEVSSAVLFKGFRKFLRWQFYKTEFNLCVEHALPRKLVMFTSYYVTCHSRQSGVPPSKCNKNGILLAYMHYF